MSYINDGSVHYKGISVEERVSNYLDEAYKNHRNIIEIDDFNNKELYKCVHKGGTGGKPDAELIDSKNKIIKISIKKKEYKNNKPSGTFDIINTTAKSTGLFTDEQIAVAYNYLNYFKNDIHHNPAILKDKKFREGFFKICGQILDSCNNKTNLFVKLAEKEFLKTDHIIVARIESGETNINTLYFSKDENLECLFHQTDKYEFDSSPKNINKTSRRIVYKSNGKIIQSPFRVRLTLNNGFHAYYGLSTANDSSILVVKIQVDGVVDFVNKMKPLKVDIK